MLERYTVSGVACLYLSQRLLGVCSSLCYLLGDSSNKIKLCSSSRGEERVRGKTMSYYYYPIPDIYLSLFKAFAIALPITSLFLLVPSDLCNCKSCSFITCSIWSAVGRLDLYFLRTNFCITLSLLTFTVTLRYLVVCAFHHTLVVTKVGILRMAN